MVASRGATTGPCDHDMGCKEKYIPCGIVDEDSGELHITFGSSYKTSDFIVDTIEAKWNALDEQEQADTTSDPDQNGQWAGEQWQAHAISLSAWCSSADAIGKPIQLLYYPPYHSKYNPIERCWGILELHWNGTKLIDVETMLEWAKSMTWKGHASGRRAEPESRTKRGSRWARQRCRRLKPDWNAILHCPNRIF